MKAFKKTAFLAIALSAAVAGLAGCKSNVKMPVTFVAVTSDTYNAEVTLGEINYKFQGNFVKNSNKFVLDAVAQGKANSGGQGGGPGGFGGFPGGGPGGNSSGPEFVGFGAGEEQGGEGGEQPGGEFPGGEFPGGGEIPGGNPTDPTNPGAGENPTDPTNPGAGENPTDPTNPGAGENPGMPGGNEGGDPTNPGGNEQPGGNDQQGGFPGMGGNDQEQTSEEPEEDTTDYSQYNFVINATYVEEKGYGYAITFTEPDNSTTTIHTDFDKIEGRHSFYYNVKHGDDSAVVHFQAKDPTFKDQLADGYQKWDVRDSEYIFYAKATGNNNSVATAYMYLHKTNADVVVNTPSGANRSLSFGMKWEEKDGTIVIHDGEETITAEKTLPDADHQGWRLTYDGNMYFCSANPEEVKWKKLTLEDFEGKNAYAFTGSYTTSGPDGGEKTANLNLVQTGNVAKLYLGTQTPSFVGSWAKDGDKLTVTIEGQTGEFELKEGKYSIIVRVSVSSFFGSQEVSIAFSQAK